jgi:hypothetical protein
VLNHDYPFLYPIFPILKGGPMSIHGLTPLAGEVLKKRYLARNYRGEIIETPADVFSRVARVVAEADRLFDAGASVRDTADRFEAAMTSLAFMPNSPCLMNAGRPLGQLAACFRPAGGGQPGIDFPEPQGCCPDPPYRRWNRAFLSAACGPSGDTIFPCIRRDRRAGIIYPALRCRHPSHRP